jgi:hypothetical protein
MTPDGETVGQKLMPALRAIARGDAPMPALMPPQRIDAKVIELPSKSG